MLTGKNCMITGARTGIGRATTELFAKNGAVIWACASKYNEEFEEDMKELSQKYNTQIHISYFDLRAEEEVKEAVKKIISESSKRIDILINNAGVPFGAFLQMTSMTALHQVFQINFFSQMLITQMISKIMMKNKYGVIVNLSSVAGLDGEPGYTAYGSSKAAVAFATKTISRELADYHIRVNAVAPGLIQTNMTTVMEESAKEKMIHSASLKRAGTSKEVAELILFLASEESSFINGQVIRIDGGLG